MLASTFLFYCSNVALVAGYTVLAALSLLPGGISGTVQNSTLLRVLSVVFFLSGGALHADMAFHALARRPFFDGGGRIVWDFTVIVCVQTLAVFVYLTSIQREKRRQRRR